MILYDLKKLPISQKRKYFGHVFKFIPYEESQTKVNLFFSQLFAPEESYREQLVSYYQFLPLIRDQVDFKEADYILFMHPYARCQDLSNACYNFIKDNILPLRKPGAKIVICGKAANLQSRLEEEKIPDLVFFQSNYASEVGKLLNVDIQDEHFVYDDEFKRLNIWPVDGCKQHCGFCRRCYMNIPFESKKIEDIKQKLDWYKANHPEQMNHISLRAENLTEYGIDLYGHQRLQDLIKLIDSYDEVKEITLDIGMNIGEITEEILDALTKSKKIKSIYMNPEAGTNRLLKVINKAHTVEKVKYVAKRLREANPSIKINSTVMVGLPTETIGDVHALADLLAEISPDSLRINYYVQEEGHTLPKEDISDGKRRRHLRELLDCIGKSSNPIAQKAMQNRDDLHPSIELLYPADYNNRKYQKRSVQRMVQRFEKRNSIPYLFPERLGTMRKVTYIKDDDEEMVR